MTAAPEWRLLCLSASPTPQYTGIEELASRGVDWMHLSALAGIHGVRPLLYRALSTTARDVVPESALQRLAADSRAIASRNLMMTGELLRLMDLFAEEDIEIVPFKGPLLSATAYGDVSLREFVDLDLLVRREQALLARSVLRKEGYRDGLSLSPRQNSRYVATQNEFPLESERGLSVEIQWAFAPRYFAMRLEPERLLSDLRVSRIGGRRLPSLSPENLLLTLCVHGAKHLWGRLAWVADLAHVIETSPGIGWSRLHDRANAIGCRRLVLTGLSLTTELFDTVLPSRFERAIASDEHVQALSRKLRQRIQTQGNHESGHSEMPLHLLHLQMRERPMDRMRHVVRLAITPTLEDWRMLSVPDNLSFLYYPIRVVRLLSKYGRV